MKEKLPWPIGDILIVCTGNICRSPMATALLRAELVEMEIRGIMVSSAGTRAPADSPASEFAIQVAENNGLNLLHHRARQLTAEMINHSDLILVMEQRHREQVIALVPAAAEKTFLLSAWAEMPQTDKDIFDPIDSDYDYYEMTFYALQAMVQNLVYRFQEMLRRHHD